MSVVQFGSKKQIDTLTTVLGNQLMLATVGNEMPPKIEADGKASTSFNSLDCKKFICVENFEIQGKKSADLGGQL